MVWCKAFALLSLGGVATTTRRNVASAAKVPIEFNSSKTVVLNAVADGRVLRNPEDDDSLFYDDMQFVSGTMHDATGHVFMGMCDASFDNPGRIVEIDPDLGYPSSFVEHSSLSGCPLGMASDDVTGDLYASIYVSDNFPNDLAASEIVRISGSTGVVAAFSRRVEGCTNPQFKGAPNFAARPGDPGCFSFLTKMVRSCLTGSLYVYQVAFSIHRGGVEDEPCALTPLHPYTLTPLHPYTLTPLHPYTLHPTPYTLHPNPEP
jgi:hypothetical protein